jgi:hypothetical protein
LQGSVLGPVLYLIYRSDLLTSDNTTSATFADDTAILATHEEPAIVSIKLQANINMIDDWAKNCRIKINQSISTHITFTLRNQTCPTVQMDKFALPPPPKKNEMSSLGIHLDRRLTWAKHIKTKRNQHWLLERSTLSIESKLLLHKAVLRSIWTYAFSCGGTDSNSNIEILQRLQSKTLRSILNTPWYINNHRIHEDLHMNTVVSDIKK